MLNEKEILIIDFEGFDYNSIIVKELSVHSKNYQETLLFKPPQAFSTVSTLNRDSIKFLTKRIHGIDWDSGFHPYISLHGYLTSLRIRFPDAIVFVDGHVKRAFISKYLEKVYSLQELGCPPIKQLCAHAFVSCENHANFLPWNPWNSQQHFWHCSKLKTAVAYQWLESRRNVNQSNVDSKFERLCAGCCKHNIDSRRPLTRDLTDI